MSFDQIGEAVGLTRDGARQLYWRAIDSRSVPREDVEGWREKELRMLETLRESSWQGALEGEESKSRVVLQVHDRIARLLGLNAPEKVDLTVSLRGQIFALAAQRMENALRKAGLSPAQRQQVALWVREEDGQQVNVQRPDAPAAGLFPRLSDGRDMTEDEDA